jgi:hypothetical protein
MLLCSRANTISNMYGLSFSNDHDFKINYTHKLCTSSNQKRELLANLLCFLQTNAEIDGLIVLLEDAFNNNNSLYEIFSASKINVDPDGALTVLFSDSYPNKYEEIPTNELKQILLEWKVFLDK